MTTSIWDKLVSFKELNSVKSSRKKQFLFKKILSTELPKWVDQGWEKSKEYKSTKYIGVTKEKPIKEQYTDMLWVLLSNMGFDKLNSDNEFSLPYDFHDSSLKEPIDICAVDEETVLIIKCFASSKIEDGSFASEIKEFASRIPGLHKVIQKQFPYVKVKYIMAIHNYIVSKKDLFLMESNNIVFFNDAAYQYYYELSKQLGNCSRYQLLGNLFAGQDIKNMDDRIPAIKGKMGNHTYYSFSIEPERLLKIGYVLHRNESHQNMMPTYQRIIKKKRLQEVQSFIDNGGYFPNSIIISIDTKKKGVTFDLANNQAENTISKIGILHIPKRYRSAYIIDGQHRLYGYSNTNYAKSNTIPVVAFVDLDRTEQIKMFMDINENQKPVPKSLRVTLNADMLWDSDNPTEQRQALRSRLAQMLGEKQTSPLFSRIVIGETEQQPEKCITVEAIQQALKKCRFFNQYGKKNTIIKEGIFDCNNNQDSCDLFYPFIEKCLSIVRRECIKEWELGDNESGILTINRGMQAIIRVIDDIVSMLVDNHMIEPKKQSVDNMIGLIQYYLSPLTKHINNMSLEDKQKLRRVFGAAADNWFWRNFQKPIADAIPNFKPEGLDEYWENQTKQYNEETKNMLESIENKVKDIISTDLESVYDEGWLIKGLPKSVYIKAKNAADDAFYKQVQNGGDQTEIPIWKFVDLADCKQIVINGSNWSSLFEDKFVREEDRKIVGGKEAKTEWMPQLLKIKNKLSKSSYSVSYDEYNLVKSIYDWVGNMLVGF